MRKTINYVGYLLGVIMLLAFIAPDLFMPAGITGAFALAVFTQTCAKNVSGANKIYIADKASVTAVTIAAGEISAITVGTPSVVCFMRVDTLQDSVYWNEVGERIGLNNWKVTNEVGFQVMPPALATNTFRQALIDGSPCGFLTILIDGNGKCWLIGHNATDILTRPLKLNKDDKKTGKGLSDADGNTIPITMGNECGGIALPLDATLTAAILAGTSTLIKWS